MAKRRLLWQIYPSYLLITLLALFCVSWHTSIRIRKFYLDETVAGLTARAQLLESPVREFLRDPSDDRSARRCVQAGRKSRTRITVIAPDGTVLLDSHEDPARMDNHADRPEVLAALRGVIGRSERYSDTLQRNMMYVAIPLDEKNAPAAALRTALPITRIDATLGDLQFNLITGGLVIVLIVAAVTWLISRRLSTPLEKMRAVAVNFANGDFSHKLHVQGSREIAELAATMNEMAAQLSDRIDTVLRQRNELDAVFSSMVEGVLAVDRDERVIHMNQAAARFLGTDRELTAGKSIQEVVRNTELEEFMARAIAGGGTTEGEIVLTDPATDAERHIQAHGAALTDADGREIGALVVLNDVTSLRRLEVIRRDFVANVSHELRTPITSIKGFIETLIDGSAHDPADTRHFLAIVARQADRMNAIIEDLLTLSRLEQDGERPELTLERGTIRETVENACEVCAHKSREKNLDIRLECPPELTANFSAPLIEQAVINLVDNAIKYSDPDGTIVVRAFASNGKVAIEVRDTGCGIPREHLARLFERFYRVDKARSRKLGGTGLGLAIVKHIAHVHGGRVEVESKPGQGSVFTIWIDA